ncbi:MAG: hypothetical protein AAFN13_16080, partial [Bacteroidota bacterium]
LAAEGELAFTLACVYSSEEYAGTSLESGSFAYDFLLPVNNSTTARGAVEDCCINSTLFDILPGNNNRGEFVVDLRRDPSTRVITGSIRASREQGDTAVLLLTLTPQV